MYPAMVRARENSWPQPESIPQLCDVLQNPLFTCITATDQFADNSFKGAVQAGPLSAILFMSNKCNEFLKMVPGIFILCNSISVRGEQYKVKLIDLYVLFGFDVFISIFVL